jgi:hypothetical protein
MQSSRAHLFYNASKEIIDETWRCAAVAELETLQAIFTEYEVIIDKQRNGDQVTGEFWTAAKQYKLEISSEEKLDKNSSTDSNNAQNEN